MGRSAPAEDRSVPPAAGSKPGRGRGGGAEEGGAGGAGGTGGAAGAAPLLDASIAARSNLPDLLLGTAAAPAVPSVAVGAVVAPAALDAAAAGAAATPVSKVEVPGTNPGPPCAAASATDCDANTEVSAGDGTLRGGAPLSGAGGSPLAVVTGTAQAPEPAAQPDGAASPTTARCVADTDLWRGQHRGPGSIAVNMVLCGGAPACWRNS